MNKRTVTIAIVLACCHLSAQTIDSIPHHGLGNRSPLVETFMEMTDGSLVSGTLLGPPPGSFVLHKLNRYPRLEFADSLIIDCPVLPWDFTAKDPQDYGKNILAVYTNDFDSGNCYLKIRRFNNQLEFEDPETHVTMDDFLGNSSDPAMLLDPNGDLVLSYYYWHNPSYSQLAERSFVRLGLDGTIKHRVTIDSLDMNINPGTESGPFLLSESPLKYCYFGDFYSNNQTHINCYVLDSLFNITECITLPQSSGAPDWIRYISHSLRYVCLMGLDDGSILFAIPYEEITSQPNPDDGVALLRYDNNEFTLLRKFHSEPYSQYSSFYAPPIGLEKSKDGNIFFVYSTNKGNGYVSVVKMTPEFDVIWQRHCFGQKKVSNGKMLVLKENKVAVVCANVSITDSESFYFIVNDDYDGLDEEDFHIRPYLFYPNPTQNQLYLQYSPDVQPACIELYDMQGRLVHAQATGLESLEMQGLTAGQYLMKVMLEDGKVLTDKVMKE